METVPDGCPTGILIDIGLQTRTLNNIKENEDQVSIKNKKEKNIVADASSSDPCTSICFLDQSPPKPPSTLKKNKFFTPKSNWKTPSPKSMKIISRDASRIVNQLFSSPINCSEVMIYDEVFPVVKSLDDASFDEFHIKSKNLPATDVTVAHDKVDQNNPIAFDLTKCPISASSSCISESGVVSDKKLSTIELQSDLKHAKEHDSISEKLIDALTPENASSQESCAVTDEEAVKSVTCLCTSKSVVASDETLSTIELQSDLKPAKELDSISEKISDALTPETASSQESSEFVVTIKDVVKSVTCVENSSPAIPECKNLSSDQFLAPEHEVTTHKKIPAVAKGFGFKKSMKHCAEKNKENEHQSNGTRQATYEPRFSKTEKSGNTIENGANETKTRKSQILEESLVEQHIPAKYSVLEKKKAKESQNLEDHLSKNMIGKPKVLQQKSNIGRSQSLFCKKNPLCKTGILFGTPKVQTTIRRLHSFHDGSTKIAIPTAEKKLIPTTESCCRVLKPKMPLNQVSNNGNGFSTPLQFGKYPQSFKQADSSSANPMRRKSLAFNSKNSLIASGMKLAAQNDQHSITKKPAVTSSSKLGFVKQLKMPSLHPKFKNDNLPRKLFP